MVASDNTIKRGSFFHFLSITSCGCKPPKKNNNNYVLGNHAVAEA